MRFEIDNIRYDRSVLVEPFPHLNELNVRIGYPTDLQANVGLTRPEALLLAAIL